MLLPKSTKWRKPHNVSYEGVARKNNKVVFGEYGMQAITASYITNNQIEAARIAINKRLRKGGKMWIKIFPHMSKTKKPIEVRMGSGKGNPEFWVAPVKVGTVLFELADVTEEEAKKAFKLATAKLPIKCKFVKKEQAQTLSKGENDGN